MVIASGLLMYKFENNEWKYLIVHPGGIHNAFAPWGIPKGILEDGEDILACAIRETEEELGTKINTTKFLDLGDVFKIIHFAT